MSTLIKWIIYFIILKNSEVFSAYVAHKRDTNGDLDQISDDASSPEFTDYSDVMANEILQRANVDLHADYFDEIDLAPSFQARTTFFRGKGATVREENNPEKITFGDNDSFGKDSEENSDTENEWITYHHIYMIQGHSIDLPMEKSKIENKALTLIRCYYEQEDVPFFVLETNYKKKGREAVYHDGEKGFRTSFYHNPQSDGIILDQSVQSDAGIYKCLIDFDNDPTRAFVYNVTAIVAPGKPIFFVGNQEYQSKVGPLDRNQEADFRCVILGGDPRPKITWRQNDEILYSAESINENGYIVSHLMMSVRGLVQCSASSSELIPPSVSSIEVIACSAPKSVELTQVGESTVANTVSEFLCTAKGSRPAPIFSWFLNNRYLSSRIHGAIKIVSRNNASRIKMTLKTTNDKDQLSCHAVVPKQYGKSCSKEANTSIVLDVKYEPKVELQIVLASNESIPKVGDKVTLRCNSSSNPKADRYQWFKNEKALTPDARIKINNSELSFKTEINDTGSYSCSAKNRIEESRSAAKYLNVLFTPVCLKSNMKSTIFAPIGEPVKVKCAVSAPEIIRPLIFEWTYVTEKRRQMIHKSSIMTKGYESQAYVFPADDMNSTDLGKVECRVKNYNIPQETPCEVQLLKWQVPSPPKNCILDKNVKSLNVKCERGYDGGDNIHFVLELQTEEKVAESKTAPKKDDGRLDENEALSDQVTPALSTILHKENSTPEFHVEPLKKKTATVLVFAENNKGRSSPFTIQINDEKPSGITIGQKILIGLVAAIPTGVILYYIHVWIRANRNNDGFANFIRQAGLARRGARGDISLDILEYYNAWEDTPTTRMENRISREIFSCQKYKASIRCNSNLSSIQELECVDLEQPSCSGIANLNKSVVVADVVNEGVDDDEDESTVMEQGENNKLIAGQTAALSSDVDSD